MYLSAMGRNQFNEDSRVKVPVILQLVRLGYEFLPRAVWEKQREPQTNILRDEFARAFVRLNEKKTEEDAHRYIDTVLVPMLNNNDLGRQFYNKLVAQTTDEVLIDFADFDNNSFHVATEVNCTNEGEEFRPDVMVFVNGLPLAFYEVKKPNSKEQMKAERDRMTRRNAQSCFRRYMNAAQFMLFSGNQEYDDGNRWQGSFYCTTSQGKPHFNFFREKNEVAFTPRMLRDLRDDDIRAVLRDTKLAGYEHTPEFESSIGQNRPASRFATSLLSRERFEFMLHFGIAFVEKDNNNKQYTRLSRGEEERIIATFEKREAVDSFAVVPSYDEMEEKDYSFSAGQYFDVKIEHIDITPEEFKQKMSAFMAEFNELSAQSAKLDEEIRKQMSFLEFS